MNKVGVLNKNMQEKLLGVKKTFLHLVLFLIVAICLLSASSKEQSDPCLLPKDLKETLNGPYKGYIVVNKNLLTERNREFYKKDHGNKCPGFIKVDFFGNKRLTYAILLHNNDLNNPFVELIIATKRKGKDWEIIHLEKSDALVVPVIWSEPSGTYNDVYGEKTLKTKYENILFVGYESVAILYSWQDGKIEKIWLAD